MPITIITPTTITTPHNHHANCQPNTKFSGFLDFVWVVFGLVKIDQVYDCCDAESIAKQQQW
ncbi:hypothetical protein MOMA_00740 [Moraxella macacae 0408225]|uniref:Uncharacterized protein n=1 Tax=Moraxella macacae 0408225 TaxID=1230338 RepID=L2F733_9GAMM|nr:hypothetical protein [Moraxella macacae]ELA08894.1 hypothetical protein MOMA_00740 [Moraxella macacae 0408225]